MMHVTYLSLGSNLGDRAGHLRDALQRLADRSIVLACLSSLYETAYVGPDHGAQPPFINCVVKATTPLDPYALLDVAQEVERMGYRKPTQGWMPRTIDIDLLLYDDVTLNSERLTLPHASMWRRAFVMVPLAEIAPALPCPSGARADEMAAALVAQGQCVRRCATASAIVPNAPR